MKVAISNIAWCPDEEGKIALAMQELGINGVEIAPTKIWPSPLSVPDTKIKEYKQFWENQGIQIVAMQSLLFGRPDLTIFESDRKRKETFDYLSGMIQLGGKLGANVLVFGSPKNRKVNQLSKAEIEEIAIPFFYDLGKIALQNGNLFCIEPNPTAYGCDFITTSQEGIDFVNKVNNLGFGLHLDAAGMTLSQEPAGHSIEDVFRTAKHFHASEVNLAPVGTGSVDHEKFASMLRNINYKSWVSIEMRASEKLNNLEQVITALNIVNSIYVYETSA